MNFNFSDTAGLGVASKPRFKETAIYDVTFDGCEATDYKDGQMKVLLIKFSNNDGTFTHTIFEPGENADQDTQGSFGPTPSPLKSMVTLLRHLGAAVCPELIDLFDKLPNNITWDQLRNKIVETTKPAIGKKTKIKLFKKERTNQSTGEKIVEAVFPSYFLKYNREGGLYMDTNFIGDRTYFTKKELEKIQKAEAAKPTDMEENAITSSSPTSDFDDDIEV